MKAEDVLKRLKLLSNPEAVAGMARFGINPQRTYGIAIPTLRKLAKDIGKDHTLAQELWDSGIHEARILASMMDDPKQVTEEQMERWVRDLDSWDVCDQVCGNLFDRTSFAIQKAREWSARPEEFVKRAGFAVMAWMAFHDKRAGDEVFTAFLASIQQEAKDNRPYVRKAVNWALRQIGKRNAPLNRAAIETARAIYRLDGSAARWIASDALRELTSEETQARLAVHDKKNTQAT